LAPTEIGKVTVYMNGGAVFESGPVSTFTTTTLPPGDYSFQVATTDMAGNASDKSNVVTVSVPGPINPPPPQSKPAAISDLRAVLNP
jgi:hypothetical protein